MPAAWRFLQRLSFDFLGLLAIWVADAAVSQLNISEAANASHAVVFDPDPIILSRPPCCLELVDVFGLQSTLVRATIEAATT